MITILNTSIITNHGTFSYKPCSLEQAKKLIARGYQSAIGHESTASVVSTLLGVDVKMNMVQYQQQPGDIALVFKLKGLAPGEKILSEEEIEDIVYEWGILEMVDGCAADAIVPPSTTKHKWWWLRDKFWWFTDYVIMPVICFLLAVGFVAVAVSGLYELLSQLF